jgi:hypothetical protein
LGYAPDAAEFISVPSAARLAMDPFENNRLLPVEVMITIAINIAAVTAGYYVVVFWGLFGD